MVRRSANIRTYSWAYSGMPSASSTNGCSVSRATCDSPSMCRYSVAMASGRSGGRVIVTEPAMVPGQPG